MTSRRPPPLRLLVCLLASTTLPSCGDDDSNGAGDGGSDGVRNVLLVTLDTTRADRIGAYGAGDAATPTLDRLAREGVRFENCMAVSPITLPSHASILTGLYPPRHGARENGTHFLEEDVVSIAERFADAGFVTGAVVSAFVLDSRFGLDQGFASYDDDLSAGSAESEYMFRETTAADTVRRARAFLADRGEERWFLWTHFFDPHATYTPPAPFDEQFADRPYDGEIAYVDAQLAVLLEDLEARGWLEDTLVVVTADHGESLGEHGESTHGIFLYDATMRIPLLVRHPSLPAGTVVEEVASLVDLAPTLAALTGVEALPTDGVSLVPALHGDAGFSREPAYQEAMSPFFQYGWSDLRALRTRTTRYVRAPREEFYDLETDPAELRNLLDGGDPGEIHDTDPARGNAIAMRGRLDALLSAGERDSRRSTAGAMAQEERLTLAELGYTWNTEDEGGEGPDSEGLPDPKDRIGESARMQEANRLIAESQFAECEALMRELIAENPASAQAYYRLGDAIFRQDRPEEALVWFEKACSLPGRSNAALQRVAALRRGLGLPKWEEWLAAAKAMQPRDPVIWVREAEWRIQEGNVPLAERRYREALEVDEACGEAWLGLGNLLANTGRAGEAQQAWQRATQADSSLADAWFSLGYLEEQAGRNGEADRHYRLAIRADPDHVEANLRLASMEIRASELEAAEQRLRRILASRPANFRANVQLGGILSERERFEEAAGHFARAAERRPDDERPCSLESGAWRAAGDPARALAAAERALARKADSVDALLAAAAAHALLEQDAEASEFLARARALDAVRVRGARAADPVLAGIER